MTVVGIDIDGIICNQLDFFDRIADRYGITDRSYRNSYNGIYKQYSPDNRMLADLIFEDHLEEFLLDSHPIDGAREEFRRFVDNDKISTYIVTSRRQENKDLTTQWLMMNGFVGHEDTLFLEDKLQSPCQVLIDDHTKHIKRFTSNARMGILQTRPYNKDANVRHRVNNLKEAYKLVEKYL